jgi:hypothetical protein
MRSWLGAAGLVVVTLVPAARAQPMLQRGAQDFSLQLSLDFESAIGDMILGQAGYGYLIKDGLSLRGTFGYAVLEDVAGDDSDYRMQEVGVATEYHFLSAHKVVPYVGFGLGWRRSHFNDLEESAVVYGPLAGVKLFLADNVALDFALRYQASSADVFVNDFVPEDTDLSTGIGLRILF